MKKILTILCILLVFSGCKKKQEEERRYDEQGYEIRVIEIQDLGVPIRYDIYPTLAIYHCDYKDSQIDKKYGRRGSLFLMALTESIFDLKVLEEVDMEIVDKCNNKDIITLYYGEDENASIELRKVTEPTFKVCLIVGNKAYEVGNFKELYSNLGRMVELDEEGNLPDYAD